MINSEDIQKLLDVFDEIVGDALLNLESLKSDLAIENSYIDVNNFVSYFKNNLDYHPSKVLNMINEFLGESNKNCKHDQKVHTFKVIFSF